MSAALSVPAGSRGDCQAIVVQLAKMVIRMMGSNQRLSMVWMHHLRGCVEIRRQHSEWPWYSFPLGPTIFLAGGFVSSPSSPGSTGSSTTLKSSSPSALMALGA